MLPLIDLIYLLFKL